MNENHAYNSNELTAKNQSTMGGVAHKLIYVL